MQDKVWELVLSFYPFTDEYKEKYKEIAKKHKQRQKKKNYISIEKARTNKYVWDSNKANIIKPLHIGIQYFNDFPIEEIIPFIDWNFFFHSWRITGRYPEIFEHPEKGKEAIELFENAQKILKEIKQKRLLKANGVIGIFEASSHDDTIITTYNKNTTSFEFLRNQEDNKDTNYCLSDFIAPNTSNIKDYMGLFAVSTGFNIEKTVQQYESEGDDYNAIMIKILADRLAEAFAELMHYKLRTEFWGYSPTEKINQDDLLKEKYRGIRPAPGYSACPEHSEKRKIFDLMNIENKTGIVLTDGYSMYPAASVCGYYFSHPEAKYFDVAKISKDQVEDYANRKNMKVKDIEVLLNSNINY